MAVYKESNIVIAGATVHFGGQPLGWLKDALTIGIEDDKIIIDDVQGVIGPVDIRRTKAGIVVKCNLYEPTLDNLRLAFGVNAAVTYGASLKTLNFDLSGDYHSGELIIETEGPDGVSRTIKYYNAKLIDRGEVSFDSYGATVIPVTFQVLRDSDYGDVFGKFEEEYVPATVQD